MTAWYGSKQYWNGKLPKRRYAIFSSLLYGNKLTVVYGRDIEYAPRWGNFVCWVGGVRPPIDYSKMIKKQEKLNE